MLALLDQFQCASLDLFVGLANGAETIEREDLALEKATFFVRGVLPLLRPVLLSEVPTSRHVVLVDQKCCASTRPLVGRILLPSVIHQVPKHLRELPTIPGHVRGNLPCWRLAVP